MMLLFCTNETCMPDANRIEDVLSFEWTETIRSDECNEDTGYGCVSYIHGRTQINTTRPSHDYVGVNTRGKLLI